MCAVAEPYAWGDSGSNTCPENAVQTGSAEACQRAAAVMGKDWGGSENETDQPRGCFWNEQGGSNVVFNAHPNGSGYARRLPLCAVGTAPRPLGTSRTTCLAPPLPASPPPRLPHQRSNT